MIVAMLPTTAFAWSAEEGTKCTSTYGDLYLGSDGDNYYSKTGNTLASLNSDLARPLEPSYDELNPPPEPEKEYRFSLGDTVYLGTHEYEVLSFDENEVVLYDTQFPLFNKTMTREEFEDRLKENPLNDHLLQVVEQTLPHDNTETNVISMTLNDYRVAPGVMFMTRSDPQLTLGKRSLKLNGVCRDKLGKGRYVEFLYHPILEVIAVRSAYATNPNMYIYHIS